MSELDLCYKVLGLEPGASPEEVNQAYKDLA
ncbi:MAG TPA: molecular chaperone DnaJ, partial [Cyanobacteria bacterium UBA8553]|nr:molecular chaperone DnaJ [Cyanobacteria bacterium UBA8553]